MKKRVVLAGIMTGLGIYALTKKEVRETLIDKAQIGKEKIDIGLDKIVSSLNTLNKVQDFSDEELGKIVEDFLNGDSESNGLTEEESNEEDKKDGEKDK